MAREHRVNQQIRAKEVRVIGEQGEQIGVMPPEQALRMAQERGVDLVEVSPTAVPPVCRLLDFDRFRYQQTKKEKEARKAHKLVMVREVKVRTNIASHDLEAKIRVVHKLLDDGSKVKISVIFRGREITHQDLGVALLKNIIQELKMDARLESPPGLEGRTLSLLLAPISTKEKKALIQPQGAKVGAEGKKVQA